MPIEYRILNAGEAHVLSRVAEGVFDYQVDHDLAKTFLSSDCHHIAVAIDAGTVVGMATGVHYVHPDKPMEMWINEVAVAPSHQRKGIGQAVVKALLNHAATIGRREAWVLTDYENKAARKTYAAAGGTESQAPSLMVSFDLR